MYKEIRLTPEEIADLRTMADMVTDFEYTEMLASLDESFKKLFHQATVYALRIKVLKESCRHEHATVISPYAKHCPRCGEYVDVKTS